MEAWAGPGSGGRRGMGGLEDFKAGTSTGLGDRLAASAAAHKEMIETALIIFSQARLLPSKQV